MLFLQNKRCLSAASLCLFRLAFVLHFFLSLALVLPAQAQAPRIRILVQSSPLAGFQYHAGAQLWDTLKTGEPLSLQREPDNPHDRRAVLVLWQGQKLGYLPRKENHAVAEALDRGERVEARIAALRKDPDPWKRVRVEVFITL